MNKQEALEELDETGKQFFQAASNVEIESNSRSIATGVVSGLGIAKSVVAQIDEPREGSWQDAIQFLEDHFGCEIPRNLDQVIEGFKSMSSLMNTVEFELDKQGSNLTSKEFVLEALERYKLKVKVPLHVGNWIEYSKDEGWDFLRSTEEMTGPMGDGSVRIWFKKNSDKYAEAWSNDFEVEQEQKWKIINDQKYCLTSIEAGYGNSLHWAFDSTKKKPILFDNEETALYTAYITGGTVEKV